MWKLNFESSHSKFNFHVKFLVAHPMEEGRKSTEVTSVRLHKQSDCLTLRFVCPNGNCIKVFGSLPFLSSVGTHSTPSIARLEHLPAAILKF